MQIHYPNSLKKGKIQRKKRENNSTTFQKEINLKLGKSNLFLMYFRLILSRRKRYQTKKESALKKNAKTMLDNLFLKIN